MPVAHQFPGFTNTYRDVYEEPERQPTAEGLAELEAHLTFEANKKKWQEFKDG